MTATLPVLNGGLASFLPPVRAWFEETFGQPTPPQAQGWPAIQRGEHTLILAPTGSGKTLAAFLWGIDRIYRELLAPQDADATSEETPGVRLLYISPLKALNNDIYRNLRVPLAGIRKTAHLMRDPAAHEMRDSAADGDYPRIQVAVRSGDTPQRERRSMVRKPPQILITTPESFYLMLTSPRAREIFRTVRTVIVDEIHTLAGNKRGVHLSLSLERLERLADQRVQRIGLSATIRPLEEVARFLGGNEPAVGRALSDSGAPPASEQAQDASPVGRVSIPATGQAQGPPLPEGKPLQPRPVTVVDAAYKKPLDLRVQTVVDSFQDLPGGSIWPALIPELVDLVEAHRTTLIFANSRRQAERAADRINIEREARAEGRYSGLIEGGVVKGVGMMAAGTGVPDSTGVSAGTGVSSSGETRPCTPVPAGTGRTDDGVPVDDAPVPVPIRVHHGSVSKERRLELERQLKAGELPALVGTSSLELGIDIGAVDLVVQLQSPKSVAQGLQRVGRSGHLVGQTSVGRIFPTHREDVIESAAIAGGMLRGEVEPTTTPRQPLDVLAQQIVAMVSVDDWEVEAVYDLVRCAYAYEALSWRVFTTTLDMLAGRFPTRRGRPEQPHRGLDLVQRPGQVYRELRPRLSWDRVNDKLAALPGSRWLALTNGGTIPDSGSFGAYLSDGKTKLGELDEEFVFETRIGDTLMLGSQVWRVIDMTDQRITVAEAPGAMARMPFWRGDYPWRPYELGRRVGAYRRAVAERLEAVRRELDLDHYAELREQREHPAVLALLDWLGSEYVLDRRSAWHTIEYLASQLDHAGSISSDRTILVEVFEDAIGDPRLVIHSPYGGRVNGPWGLALTSALRERTGLEVEVQTNDDGILFRLLDSEAELPIDLVTGMTPHEARERILRELPTSAVFGVRFRQNAARALLLPGARGGKRTPLWLQRLRAKDLLHVVRQIGDFPIVAETVRDCLQDVLDLPHLEEVLVAIHEGKIQVQVIESRTPSPVAQSLMYDFINIYMYEYDTPKAERQLQELSVSRDLLQDLLQDVALDELLRPEAIREVQGRLQHTAPSSQARSVEELAVHLQQMGDLSTAEIAARCTVDPAGWIEQLCREKRLIEFPIPTVHGLEPRWVAAEYAGQYRAAFGGASEGGVALDARQNILARYLAQTGPVTLEVILARYAFDCDWLQAELDRLIEQRELVHGRFTPGTRDRVSEFVDRRTLERIHRRTLSILRHEVQPVPLAAYAAFLARWQHLCPGTRLRGEGALTRLLQQLRAFPAVGLTWERDVLPLRLVHYRASELDALCQGGELVWVGSGGVDPRRGRVRFLFRGEGHVYLEPPPEEPELEETAQVVYDFLRSEGAAFFGDICAAAELRAEQVETALIELVMAGLVTNDSPEALRQIVQRGSPRPPAPKPLSSLEAQLARRRQRLGTHARPLGQRPGPAQYRAAKRRVRQRLERPGAAGAPPRGGPESRWVGRWTLVHRFGVLGKALPDGERSARQARQLLARWGIVTRESLEAEIGAWTWATIYRQLVRLEMRGEVRRGYFVSGLPGAQFALPEAVERLREIRDQSPVDPELVVLSACDPANLYGPQREGGAVEPVLTATGEPLAFSRVPSTWLVQQRGRPVLVAADSGARITLTEGVDEGLARRALQALLDHLGTFSSRVGVETWNEEPVLGSAGQAVLEGIGFYRSYPEMVWDRP